MIKLFTGLLAITVFLFGTAAAQIVKNGSFESATIDPGFYSTLPTGSTAIDGWIVTGSIDYIGTWWVASDSNRSVDLNSSMPGSIAQSFSTTKGSVYLVLFDMAGNPDGGPYIKTLRIDAAETSHDTTFDVSGRTRQDMGWTEMSFDFMAVDTVTTLTFTSLVSGAFGPVIDNVRVDAVTSVGEPSNRTPMSFELHQNYPNPFNPSTEISYTLHRPSFVKLTIYDLLGRTVKTIVNGFQNTGEYSVQFNGANLSNGTYFYRLNAGDLITTKRMILLK